MPTRPTIRPVHPQAGHQRRRSFKGRLPLAIIALLLALILPSSALAAPGDLDLAFGTGGIVTSDLNDARGSDVAIQSDGKLVVVGSTSSCTEDFSCHSEFLIERFNDNGTLDSSFGGDGIVTTDFGNESQSAAAVKIEPSGKIIVGGATSNSEPEIDEFAVARYNSDGSLDTTFGGGDGKATASINDVDHEGIRVWSGSMVLRPDGKVVLGGSVYVRDGFGTWHLALARFNADGSVDTSFGSGSATVGPAGHLFGLAEESSGKLLAAGRMGLSEFGVARFNASGSLDTSFADDGTTTLDLSSVGSQADDVIVQPDGKIVASGFGSGLGFAVARFNSDGTTDPSFGGGDGLLLTDFRQPCCGIGAAISIALQPDGRIVVAGQWNPDEDSFDMEWAIGRLYSNGAPDKGFGPDGLVTTDVAGGGYENYASGVAIQPDEKIVAVGGIGAPNQDLAVVRYEGGQGPPQPLHHHLRIDKIGSGEGFIIGDELYCGPNCAANYSFSETVEVKAFADFDSTFTGWSTISGDPGTCVGMTTPCEVELDSDVELVATFDGEPPPPLQYELNVFKEGTGDGTVSSSPATGIDCGASCSAFFDEGETITLTATSAPGSTFAGWSGAGCSGTGACEVVLDEDVDVTAKFTSGSDGGDEPPPTDNGGTQLSPASSPLPPAITDPSRTANNTAAKRKAARKRALKKCKKLEGKAKRRCIKKANKRFNRQNKKRKAR